jgi:CheY-like chemotaxis protein
LIKGIKDSNKKKIYDLLILMDIHMPVLNGIDASKQIDKLLEENNKTNKSKIRCRLFFISANLDTQFMGILESIKIYCGYLNKPVPKKQLFKIIENENN